MTNGVCVLDAFLMHSLSKNLLLNSMTEFRQTKCVIMMTMEGPIKIVNFMTPGAGVLVMGRDHIIISYSANVLFLLKKIFFFSPRNRSDKLSIL